MHTSGVNRSRESNISKNGSPEFAALPWTKMYKQSGEPAGNLQKGSSSNSRRRIKLRSSCRTRSSKAVRVREGNDTGTQIRCDSFTLKRLCPKSNSTWSMNIDGLRKASVMDSNRSRSWPCISGSFSPKFLVRPCQPFGITCTLPIDWLIDYYLTNQAINCELPWWDNSAGQLTDLTWQSRISYGIGIWSRWKRTCFMIAVTRWPRCSRWRQEWRGTSVTAAAIVPW